MSYIIFENEGEIDKRVISVMGVSIKDDNAIGYFGTGLKYSIATLMRNSAQVVIHAGLERLDFKKQLETVRGKEFYFIYMNDNPLPFTTELGRNWQMWQAYRELHSNCLDEGGKVYKSNYVPEPQPGKTIIAVKGDLFEEQYENRSAIFIGGGERPIMESPFAEVYSGNGVHYRRVRVKDSCSCLFKYNILADVTLTEDRTAKYDFQVLRSIGETIATSQNQLLIERFVTLKWDECLEGQIDYTDVESVPSAAFLDTVARVNRERKADLKSSALALYKKHVKTDVKNDPVVLSDFEKKQLFKACELAEKLGFPVHEYPINAYTTLGDGVLALAFSGENGKEIMVSKELFTKGVTNLSRGIIEEFIHLRHNLRDETRQMQNFLFDKMMHFGMEAIGEVA